MTTIESATLIDDNPEIRRLQLVEVVLRYCASIIWPDKPNSVKDSYETARQLRELLRRKGITTFDELTNVDNNSNSVDLNSNDASDKVFNEVTSNKDDMLFCINEHEHCSCNNDKNEYNGSKATAECNGYNTSEKHSNGHFSLHHTFKKGQNGLLVASADVIVCKNDKKSIHHSHHCHEHEHHLTANNNNNVSNEKNEFDKKNIATNADAKKECALVYTKVSSTNNNLENKEISSQTTTVTSDMRQSKAETSIPLSVAMERKEKTLTSMNGTCNYANTQEHYHCTENYDQLTIRGTPATTLNGELVVVSECGSPYSVNEEEFNEVLVLPLRVRRLSGGITNELFHVYDQSDLTCSVVVRVFGKETERVISRESELFYQSLFLPTYVHGINFLIYSFLSAYTVLPYTEMMFEAQHIARALAAFQVRATLASKQDCRTQKITKNSCNSFRGTENNCEYVSTEYTCDDACHFVSEEDCLKQQQELHCDNVCTTYTAGKSSRFDL